MERVYENSFVENLSPLDRQQLERQTQKVQKLAGVTTIAAGITTALGLTVLPEPLQNFAKNVRESIAISEVGALFATGISLLNLATSSINLDLLKHEGIRRTLGRALPIHHYPLIQNYENIIGIPKNSEEDLCETKEMSFNRLLKETDAETLKSYTLYWKFKSRGGAVFAGLGSAGIIGSLEGAFLTGEFGLVNMAALVAGVMFAPAGLRLMRRDANKINRARQAIEEKLIATN